MYVFIIIEIVLCVYLFCFFICYFYLFVYFLGLGVYGALFVGGVDFEGDRFIEGEGIVGIFCGVQVQEVDVGYDRGYGMLDIKNKFNIL